MQKRLLAGLFFVLAPMLIAQQPLNNDSVIKLVKAGLSDDLIITTINASPGNYDTSTTGLISLKGGGASDKVISAIVLKSSGAGSAAPTPAAAAASPTSVLPPGIDDIGGIVQKRGATAAINASMDNLVNAKGQVAAEEGGGLWILGGIGSQNGLKIGDRLHLIHDNVVKDKAGKEVYRKPIEIGLLEVTDVSQPDHAEARFVPGSTNGPSVNPQPNDMVTVDIEYAKKLRGGGVAPSNSAAGEAGSPTDAGASSAEIEDVIKRADSYVHDQFWSQALDEYKNAAAVNPNEQRVLQGETLSHYMLGDFLEGDKLADKLLQSGGTFSFPIAHFHGMGLCTGELKIQRGKLAYTSSKGDGFDVASQGIAGIEFRKISKGVMANEKIPDLMILNIQWRDPGGHEKSYQMLPYLYSKQQQILGGHNFGSAFPMGDSDVAQMQKFEESMVVLIQKYSK